MFSTTPPDRQTANLPICCTLTGADESTPVPELAALSAAYPFVEWGVLYSPSRAGSGRFPSWSWLDAFVEEARRTGVRTALHLCGRAVGQFLEGDPRVWGLAARFGRTQLNFNVARRPLDLEGLDRAIQRFGYLVITQHNRANRDVWRHITASNHQVLFDSSGGRGRAAGAWPSPLAGKLCGFAGGLGPENIAEHLANVQQVVGDRPYWVDMEGKLRRDDQFDLERCREVLATVASAGVRG